MSFDLLLEGGDLAENASGELSTVTGLNKAKQDIIKQIISVKGDNKFHNMLGSEVNKKIIGNNLDGKTTEALLTTSVVEAVNYLIQLQRNQKSSQVLSPSEEIISVKNVKVTRDSKEPRQLNVVVYILVASGEIIAESMLLNLG